jgi:hypothetical protein
MSLGTKPCGDSTCGRSTTRCMCHLYGGRHHGDATDTTRARFLPLRLPAARPRPAAGPGPGASRLLRLLLSRRRLRLRGGPQEPGLQGAVRRRVVVRKAPTGRLGRAQPVH